MSTSASTPPFLLQSLVNHIALPPQLPGKEDKNLEQIENALTTRLLEASRILRDQTDDELSQHWEKTRNVIQVCKNLNAGAKLNKASLLTEFRKLEHRGLLILHIADQNAALLIRRHHDGQDDIVVFEAFEASALSEKVLAAEAALQWDFPGCAVAIPYNEFDKPLFQDSFSSFLEQASRESIKRFAARTNKAASFTVENRDTVDPALITQMLMTILEVHGYRMYPPLLRKRVRDDVCWAEAEKPWRRCPFWLVLRVGLQRYLCSLHGGEVGRVQYKFLLSLMLARFLQESANQIGPESVSLLRAKLARRLVKIEAAREKASADTSLIYDKLFGAFENLFHKTLHDANESVLLMWESFKKAIRRPVPRLQRRANPQDLVLALPNSRSYLERVLQGGLYMSSGFRNSASYRSSIDFDVSKTATKDFQAFADRYFELSEIEAKVEELAFDSCTFTSSRKKHFAVLPGIIQTYITNALIAYDSNPEQKSVMLLTVMHLWMEMDKSATQIFPLLMDYSPGLPLGIFDVLQLAHSDELTHLEQIEEYLRDRQTKCRYPHLTIFDDPSKDCFAARYFDHSAGSQKLQNLLGKIEAQAEDDRTRKEEELVELTKEFEELEKTIATTTCIYTTDGFGSNVHDDRHCTKCFLQRKARRMKIDVHEHPLPSNPAQMKAVLFELVCPESFEAYRNVTWRILGHLAQPTQMDGSLPRSLLQEYSQLKDYKTSMMNGVTLASTTKSFLSTHYNGCYLPVSIEDVCLPNGLKLGYFDSLTRAWPGRQAQKPTFAHQCHTSIPTDSPFVSLQLSADCAVDLDKPSSYEVVASQTQCPPGLNTQEFTAYQALLSGRNRKWPSILIELGSSNLNFSTEAVVLLVSRLALTAGPACETDYLRAVHRIFRDELFCRRLIEQICQRLDGISSNFREKNCMDMLLTLILRLCFIASEPIVSEAFKVLEQARKITHNWIRQLRSELRQCIDVNSSRKCSRYLFWAALLCRRTFAVYAKAIPGLAVSKLQPEALCCFIECAITLQDNLAGSPTTLASQSRNALIRDLKMVYQIRHILRQSVENDPRTLESAINNIWPQPEGDLLRSYSEMKFLDSPNKWWIHSKIKATEETHEQYVHLHLLEGHLFVDGQPMGKLPAEHRESVILEQLFGRQNLLIYPSGLHGMTYMVAFQMQGHQIHLGLRDGSLIVRACYRGSILELIPQKMFGDHSNFDLPASLVDQCVHWLNLRSGVIEIRKEPDIWKPKESNWLLDLNTRTARRRRSSLVDPQSPSFQRIAGIFDRFEGRSRLTVFQPHNGSLSVELRRLELAFFVNHKNLLECRELRSEIDSNQDAGTFYGLRSMIVLQDVGNPSQRSIIVPIGPVRYTRHRFHVAVDVENTNGNYGRFTINDVLGRLDCPIEPRLLYLKVELHAYTSFVVPDPLTSRTGGEEALHSLKSGYCQPWTPITPAPLGSLRSIADLTPRREYYPKDLKTMQQVFWNPHLTATIQDNELGHAVEAIWEKSKRLSVFTLNKVDPPAFEPRRVSVHLWRRASRRLGLYQRPSSDTQKQIAGTDLLYDARDGGMDSQATQNVFESSMLLKKRPSEILTTTDLAGILQNWSNFGGYERTFDRFLLSDRLDVQFSANWGALVNLSRASGPKDVYHLTFLFSLMSFRNDAEMDVVRVLIAFAVFEGLKSLEPPHWPNYTNFRQKHVPSVENLVQLIKPCCAPYQGDFRSQFHLSHKQRRALEQAESRHEERIEDDCKTLARHLISQWPCAEPTFEGSPEPSMVDMHRLRVVIQPEWLRLFHNMELSFHIQEIQQILDSHSTKNTIKRPELGWKEQEVLPAGARYGELPTLSIDLLAKRGPDLSARPRHIMYSGVGNGVSVKNGSDFISNLSKENRPYGQCRPSRDSLMRPSQVTSTVVLPCRDVEELGSIIAEITDSQSKVRQAYGQDLMQSLEAFQKRRSLCMDQQRSVISPSQSSAISNAWREMNAKFDNLSLAFAGNDLKTRWLQEGGLWPCITPITLLEQLRSTSTHKFGFGMKESLVAFALSITALQRHQRIKDAELKKDDQIIRQEQRHLGHVNWQPLQNPDWLLLEIDANILIRPDQVDVALATISPASKSNSVLQMNMGQGKTSCIMPMVSAVLADTKNLARVVVPKALLLQTAQLLQGRLGGLVGRQVTHIPFSRKTPTTSDTMKAFLGIHKEIRASSGVIVALPEHILSFVLSGLQRLSDARIPEANSMIKIQAWLNGKSRDVLDECDFTLAVRTQLIYPSGSQRTVNGHPHRWETAEALLRLVNLHLWNLQQDFPQSIEVFRRPQGGFPVTFFLRKDAEDALIGRLVTDIVHARTSIIPIQDCTQSDRVAIKKFISDATVSPAVAEQVQQMFPDRPAAKHNLYLLRGLLVHRILLLALKKRWNVQYGLHPQRDPMAVPFHAKGVPSEQAEWGHPDVSILFTCLSHYYGGVDLAQLRQSLEHLVKSDDPSSEYDRWTCSCNTLPDSLREWNVINVDDESQLKEIWLHLRSNVVVIDYFLNHFVFPRHAKQFRVKLQASGWDIPLFSPSSPQLTGHEHFSASTTGFSGTNDNRTLLPANIKQHDLPGLSHTNAEVLTYLLQPRNRGYNLAADHTGRRLTEFGLLNALKYDGIRMLIDAGAQILEMDNLTLAKTWLKVDSEMPAAVYFNTDNKPFVIYRNGHQVPLLASPFAENLGDCLVYLDEAHTRGTDLKMPAHARGALTLGLGQTKDATVQAAMRLRQLATTQSIVFFAPPEVHQSILDLRQKNFGYRIDAKDVIYWLLHETCRGIEQMQPLYFSHGVDYCRRTQAALDNPDYLADSEQREAYLESLRQNEHMTLQKMYAPRPKSKPALAISAFSPRIAAVMKELNSRRKGFQDTGEAVHASALQEVEQEREVAFEVEAVREVQKPVHYSPLSFPGLHRDIISFARTGMLVASSEGYEHGINTLRRTALGQKFCIKAEAITSRLYVSKEFTRTVRFPLGRLNDNFLRPINWVLWSVVSETAMAIIPEEAELLIPIVRSSLKSPTHILTYAAPVTRKMLHFNDLCYYSIPVLPQGWKPPGWLTVELGFLSGRLYFEFAEYDDLCKFIGVRGDSSSNAKLSEETSDEDVAAGASTIESAFTAPVPNQPDAGSQPVKESQAVTLCAKPLSFLQEWLALQRKGQDFTHTPMGYVCQGKPLTEDHPFFGRSTGAGERKTQTTVNHTVKGFAATTGDDRVEDEDDQYDEDIDEQEDDGYLDEGWEDDMEIEDFEHDDKENEEVPSMSSGGGGGEDDVGVGVGKLVKKLGLVQTKSF